MINRYVKRHITFFIFVFRIIVQNVDILKILICGRIQSLRSLGINQSNWLGEKDENIENMAPRSKGLAKDGVKQYMGVFNNVTQAL